MEWAILFQNQKNVWFNFDNIEHRLNDKYNETKKIIPVPIEAHLIKILKD